MVTTKTYLTLFAVVGLSTLFSGCSTPEVQDTRQTGLERRQDRIDSRTYSRQARWEERARREDARIDARMDSW